jgi:hypothetical protein
VGVWTRIDLSVVMWGIRMTRNQKTRMGVFPKGDDYFWWRPGRVGWGRGDGELYG